LILDNDEKGLGYASRFFFQTWWFGVPGFGELVKEKIAMAISDSEPQRSSIDLWQGMPRGLSQFLKGRDANLGKEKRAFRESLLLQVANLDNIADSTGLGEEGWALRYHLENQIM
jgi:hypothetical protein